MPIVRAIIVGELREEPSALLGTVAWGEMLNVAQVFSEEQRECYASLAGIEWRSDVLAAGLGEFRCPSCRSSLVRNVNSHAAVVDDLLLTCSHCGENAQIESVVESALADILECDAYDAAKEGSAQPIANCPECGLDTFVVREDRCPCCGFSLVGCECDICGQAIGVDDYETGGRSTCSYHAYLLSKDD